jgi:hypothetical protein
MVAVALPLVSYIWAAKDLSRESASPSAAISAPVRPRSGGFEKLAALTARVRQAKIDSHRLPPGYDDDRRTVDELLDSDLVRSLPGAVEEVLASAASGAAERDVNPRAGESTWPGAYTVVRLLSLQMQRQWARQDEGAWLTGRLQLRFIRFLLGQARSFDELTSAEGSCAAVLRAIATAIDAGRLTPEQLREITDSSVPSDLVDATADAARTEYAIFEGQLDQVRSQGGGLLSRVFFHPNRTRRAWLASMAGFAESRQLDDLDVAQRALANAAATLSDHPPLIRNSAGSRLLAMSIRGNATAIAQVIDLVADFRLVGVRAALALHRISRGVLPTDLAEVREPHLAEIARDPWSHQNFRFSRSEGRLYSVGRDGRDDHGHFTRDLSYGGAEVDLGLRFSKE